MNNRKLIEIGTVSCGFVGDKDGCEGTNENSCKDRRLWSESGTLQIENFLVVHLCVENVD
jgi:hypothetical protein